MEPLREIGSAETKSENVQFNIGILNCMILTQTKTLAEKQQIMRKHFGCFAQHWAAVLNVDSSSKLCVHLSLQLIS